MFDVMIIGGGPGGYTAAGKAAENGLKVILFEKDKLGGTCLNRGCIPTKSLIHSAEIYDRYRKSSDLLPREEELSFCFTAAAERRDKTVDSLRTGIEKGLKAKKVEIVYGEAKILEEGKILCNETVYEGKDIIIAAGSKVSLPPIEGREVAVTSDELLIEREVLPKSLVIIGGGVIGVEIADAYAGMGTEVTILEMADHILPNMEKEVAQRAAMFLKKRGVKINTGVRVLKIEKTAEGKSVLFEGKKEETVTAEEVLLAAGRIPNTKDLGIREDRGIIADEEGRTELPHVYVIGDAKKGNVQLAHMAMADAENVIDTILGRESSVDTKIVPSCIYTHTEITVTGMSEEEAKEKGLNYQTKKVLTGANGKAQIEESESGYVKVVTVDDVLVGAVIIAPHATEMIGELSLAIQKKMTVKDFHRVIHPHPSISEMLTEVTK